MSIHLWPLPTSSSRSSHMRTHANARSLAHMHRKQPNAMQWATTHARCIGTTGASPRAPSTILRSWHPQRGGGEGMQGRGRREGTRHRMSEEQQTKPPCEPMALLIVPTTTSARLHSWLMSAASAARVPARPCAERCRDDCAWPSHTSVACASSRTSKNPCLSRSAKSSLCRTPMHVSNPPARAAPRVGNMAAQRHS